MSEPNATPPPPTPPPTPPASGDDSNRGIMIVLAYLWILALVPLLVEKEDQEVQWHAKHGLVLLGLEIIIWVVISAVSATGVGCILALFSPLIMLIFLIIRIICIVKGLKNERFLIPGISQYADKF